MNYSFSPVKSGNLEKELNTIFAEDMEYTYRSLKDSGIIILLIGLFIAAIISGLKLLVHSVEYAQKPTSDIDVLKLGSETFAHKDEEDEAINPVLTMREASNRNKDRYQVDSRIKCLKTEALNNLRIHLYQNNLELQGYIIKTINHKMEEDDLIKLSSGENIGHTLTTTQITFGNKINKLLEAVLPTRVKLKKKKSSGDTYLIAENDDYGFLQEHLRNLYQEPIKVRFDDLRNN